MKKSKKILKLVIIVAISSFILSILMHNGYWQRLILAIKSVKWYYHILLVFFNFFFIILIHELGHLFSFVFNKIKIKALFVLIFVLRKDKRWHFEIKLKNIKLIGGLVVPILPEIKSDEDFESIKKKFSKALIMGPITSLVYFFLIAVLFLLIWFFTTNLTLIGILFTSFIVTLLMTILIHVSSKLNTDNLYGDYIAYRKFKEEKFSLLQIIQYAGFNNDERPLEDLYLFNKIDIFLENNSLGYQIFDLGLVMYYLIYYLWLPDVNTKSLEKILKYYNVTQLASSKNGLELAYLIAVTNYKTNRLEQAFIDFNKIQTIKNRYVSEEKQQLLKLQYENMLYINDNTNLILENREIVIREFDILAPIFNIDEELEYLTKKLPFKKYQTEILCYIPKNK